MRKHNQSFKNFHNTKNILKNITDAPNGDAIIVADNDDTDDPNNSDDDAGSTDSKKSPYSLIKPNHAPDAADDDVAFPDDSASPKYIIDSKLRRKIDPRSTIKK